MIGAHEAQRWQVVQLVRVCTWFCSLQLGADGSTASSSRLPGHVGHLLERAQVRLGLAVAVEAEAHGQRLGLLDRGHLVDAPVAGDAADALVHVDGVVEVDEVGNVVDLLPDDGLALEVAAPQRLEQRALVPDLRMAVEAQLRVGNRRRGASDRRWCGRTGSRSLRHACGGGGRTGSVARPDPACRARAGCARSPSDHSSVPTAPPPTMARATDARAYCVSAETERGSPCGWRAYNPSAAAKSRALVGFTGQRIRFSGQVSRAAADGFRSRPPATRWTSLAYSTTSAPNALVRSRFGRGASDGMTITDGMFRSFAACATPCA